MKGKVFSLSRVSATELPWLLLLLVLELELVSNNNGGDEGDEDTRILALVSLFLLSLVVLVGLSDGRGCCCCWPSGELGETTHWLLFEFTEVVRLRKSLRSLTALSDSSALVNGFSRDAVDDEVESSSPYVCQSSSEMWEGTGADDEQTGWNGEAVDAAVAPTAEAAPMFGFRATITLKVPGSFLLAGSTYTAVDDGGPPVLSGPIDLLKGDGWLAVSQKSLCFDDAKCFPFFDRLGSPLSFSKSADDAEEELLFGLVLKPDVEDWPPNTFCSFSLKICIPLDTLFTGVLIGPRPRPVTDDADDDVDEQFDDEEETDTLCLPLERLGGLEAKAGDEEHAIALLELDGWAACLPRDEVLWDDGDFLVSLKQLLDCPVDVELLFWSGTVGRHVLDSQSGTLKIVLFGGPLT